MWELPRRAHRQPANVSKGTYRSHAKRYDDRFREQADKARGSLVFRRRLCLALAAASGGAVANNPFNELMRRLEGNRLPSGFASANGRLELEKIEIATKLAGRIAEVLVKEGERSKAARFWRGWT